MVNLTINGISASVENGTTILEAAKSVGMDVPTLCYLKDIHEIGACRMCVVEVEGCDSLVTACNTVCEEGMSVLTTTWRVRESRRTTMELLLSQHRTNCPSCERSGTCHLQYIANSLYLVDNTSFKETPTILPWNQDYPIIRDESKCIKCYRCVSICEKVQGLNIWDITGTGIHTSIGVTENRTIEESDCVNCGQCITHCPTNALHSRDDTIHVYGPHGFMTDHNKVTVVQVAPAVRAAWGEAFGLSPEVATEGRLAAALRHLGFDYVFDTNFSADLTIMEEANEFLERMKEPEKYQWPMFTSCCPGWVRFAKSQYPDMVDNLSSAKSPQQMFGAVTKSYFAEKIGVKPEDIYCVSIMPCTAKKAEINIPNINDAAEGVKDVDIVLTTRELCRMITADQIDVTSLQEEEFDSPLGSGTGAAVIFGTTGGVMEAALRTAHFAITGENPDADQTFRSVRARNIRTPWVEATYNIGGVEVRTAVVSGLGNARDLLRAIRRKEVDYHFVEVMACPGGCVGGGGQPIKFNEELAGDRAETLYNYDRLNNLRFSHENPDIQTLYSDYLTAPLSEKAHHLLHTDHHGWETPLSPHLDEDVVVTR